MHLPDYPEAEAKEAVEMLLRLRSTGCGASRASTDPAVPACGCCNRVRSLRLRIIDLLGA
jgi:hypothetical protein